MGLKFNEKRVHGSFIYHFLGFLHDLSWEKSSINQLRRKFSDSVTPLKRLELSLENINIGLRITSGEGAFRVHPRLPMIQIWSSMKEGYEYVKALNSAEGRHIQDMKKISKIRTVKETMYRARLEGRTPRMKDRELANTRIDRREKASLQHQAYEVNLKEIYSTVMNIRKRMYSQPELVVPLGGNRPVQISKRLPIRLVLKRA